ncbi:transposase family protein [Okeania hirsuta]|nr:transposase family protein [Okeania hirsuta]
MNKKSKYSKVFENWYNYSVLTPRTLFCQKPRVRALGGGRKARLLEAKDKLFFILFYFKCYPTFDVAGILFDLHRSRAHYWMLRLQPLP